MSSRTLFAGAAVVVAITTIVPRSLGAQSQQNGEIRKQLEALAAGQAAMQKQLEELTVLIRGRAAAPSAPAAPAVPANLALATAARRPGGRPPQR